jgi:photosystem II stability/assembly factor-like uncharacterized protein
LNLRLPSRAFLGFAFVLGSSVVRGEGLGISSPSSARVASWRLTSPALFGVTVSAIAIDPRTSNRIYVGGSTRAHFGQRVAVFRSDDAGSTWRQIQNGLFGLFVTSFLVHPGNPNVLYVGIFGGGVFKSLDRGDSWTMLRPGVAPWVNSLAIDETNPETLYVALGGDGIYKTTDGGATWTLVSASLGDQGLVGVSVIVDPTSSSRIYTTTAGLDLYRSQDAGGTWQRVSRGIQRLLWIDSTGALYALGEDGMLLKSLDADITWTVIGAGLPTVVSLRALAGDPASPAVLYAGTGGLGVFRSGDGGLTWSAFNEGTTPWSVSALLIPATGSPILYAGTDRGLFDYRARAEFQVAVPAVASLHGVPPAFFHSDVWIFNGSAESVATVTATYRCFIGSCSGAPQMFSIPSRQVKAFRDVAVTLFNAPESAGAVEFESDQLIVVGSRLYTPDASQPTTGMFVPGLKPEEASARQVLTSLSHSADATRGFRTNVGLYNGTDSGTFVSLTLYEASGANLGQTLLFPGPRQALQINDAEIFQRLGISRDVPDFYCVVTAYPFATPIHSYAVVIDNRSQDPIFVTGQDAAGLPESKITLPAVASLPGAGGTFFRSDVRIWNASSNIFAAVTARFACFAGNCGERLFTVAPGQMLAWDDIVTSLFHAASTGGAMEFVSINRLVVTSRLYTPAATEPTVGMFVPGLPPGRASPAIVLNGLSHPGDSSSGSRVNVGVFNQADVAQVVTYRLFDGAGNLLGQTARLFAPRESFQVNDVFGFLGVSEGVESAYCLIEGSELLPLFAYAAVIDNRSQDPIFIPGQDDPEHPPIVPFAAK